MAIDLLRRLRPTPTRAVLSRAGNIFPYLSPSSKTTSQTPSTTVAANSMARARRRATRSTAKQPSEPPSPLSSRSNTPGPGEPAPTDVNVDLNPSPTRTGTAAVDDSTCPSCTEATTALFVEKEKWIMCDACKTWYHWRCAGNDEDLDVIDKWYNPYPTYH